MALLTSFSSYIFIFMFFMSHHLYPAFSSPLCGPNYPEEGIPIAKEDIDLMQFPENLEFLEAECFLWSALGYGLDVVNPELAKGGPPPIGAQKANLDPLVERIITEFAYQEVGHLRALGDTVGLIQRPLLNLQAANFALLMDMAFGYKLMPPFNPYRDGLSFMVAAYMLPYVGEVGYVGTNPFLKGYLTKSLLVRLLGVESGQDKVVRTYLSERAGEVVKPYNRTVAEFTIRISELRNSLAKCGLKDEGIIVPPELGAENRTYSNVISANYYSLSYSRTPAEILRIVYGTGDEHAPGGFYPKGGNGRIARQYLEKP